jgi:hypothetical protein
MKVHYDRFVWRWLNDAAMSMLTGVAMLYQSIRSDPSASGHADVSSALGGRP